jgi:hypothetical protein
VHSKSVKPLLKIACSDLYLDLRNIHKRKLKSPSTRKLKSPNTRKLKSPNKRKLKSVSDCVLLCG